MGCSSGLFLAQLICSFVFLNIGIKFLHRQIAMNGVFCHLLIRRKVIAKFALNIDQNSYTYISILNQRNIFHNSCIKPQCFSNCKIYSYPKLYMIDINKAIPVLQITSLELHRALQQATPETTFFLHIIKVL